MSHQPIAPVCLLFLFSLVAPAHAFDVSVVTFLPILPPAFAAGSQVFGLPAPSGTSLVRRVCPGNALMTGLRIHHNSLIVTGMEMRCRFFGHVGGVDTSFFFDAGLAGRTSTASRLLECDSGRAVSGVRVRSGSSVDAVSIACGSVSPDFTTVRAFTGDPSFGTGRGAVVNRGSTGSIPALVGGPGGFANAFDCPADQPFVQQLEMATSANTVNAFHVTCGTVLTKPADGGAASPDFVPRTRFQQRVISTTNDADAFTVDVFNVGSTATVGLDHYVELVFSSLDVNITVLPAACTFLSSGRIRCPLSGPTFASGSSRSFAFEYRALRIRPEAPIIVVQTSYLVDDGGADNNTYGFAVTVKP